MICSGTAVERGMNKANAAEKGETMHNHKKVSVTLDQSQQKQLINGLSELLRMTEGMQYQTMSSEKYPYPLSLIAYERLPEADTIRADIRNTIHTDPVGILEHALALLELYASNQKSIENDVPDDSKFLSDCFSSKRLNGWIAFLGNSNHKYLKERINDTWQFRFFDERSDLTDVYILLNMLVRYAHVYGRKRYSDHDHDHFMDEQCPGPQLDTHDMIHFIDEICPGLLVCHGKMTDLELTVSLMAMKIGVPAIVPEQYPFPLGKTINVNSIEDIVNSVVMFPNIRRTLDFPEIPDLPDYCKSSYGKETFKTHTIWGDSEESFCILQKGPVEKTGFDIQGQPEGPLGIVITVDAQPMDAYDCDYIENSSIGKLSYISGVTAYHKNDCMVIEQSKKAGLKPSQIGEVLYLAVRHEFPKLKNVHVDIIFDQKILTGMRESVQEEKRKRAMEIAATTEETTDRFYSCVGCSAFAPNHMCVITPERPPQCGRPYEMIKTGALYAFDDMSNIHHNIQHRTINSFQAFDKGTCIDHINGEWTGVNDQIRRLTHTRTRRTLLHSLKENPHTGCGCFRLILFETQKPRMGIGVMDRKFKGTCPDGRSWKELHYSLGGKQTPGVTGASPNYLFSNKFLQAHNGWDSVVWVSPEIAQLMGDKLPSSVTVGSNEDRKS